MDHADCSLGKNTRCRERICRPTYTHRAIRGELGQKRLRSLMPGLECRYYLSNIVVSILLLRNHQPRFPQQKYKSRKATTGKFVYGCEHLPSRAPRSEENSSVLDLPHSTGVSPALSANWAHCAAYHKELRSSAGTIRSQNSAWSSFSCQTSLRLQPPGLSTTMTTSR